MEVPNWKNQQANTFSSGRHLLQTPSGYGSNPTQFREAPRHALILEVPNPGVLPPDYQLHMIQASPIRDLMV